MGRMTLFAICGGKSATIRDSHNEAVGILLLCGEQRAVEIVLDWMDTYTVRRVRLVTRGSRAGEVIVEAEYTDVYCDQLSEIAYTAGCWK
jgi:hypothetical protein